MLVAEPARRFDDQEWRRFLKFKRYRGWTGHQTYLVSDPAYLRFPLSPNSTKFWDRMSESVLCSDEAIR